MLSQLGPSMRARNVAQLISYAFDTVARCHASIRHHHPAWWPPDDSLGRASPDPFAQPRMTVGAHHQEIDASDLDLRLEYLSDGTAVNPHHFEACIDAVFGQMAD